MVELDVWCLLSVTAKCTLSERIGTSLLRQDRDLLRRAIFMDMHCIQFCVWYIFGVTRSEKTIHLLIHGTGS